MPADRRLAVRSLVRRALWAMAVAHLVEAFVLRTRRDQLLPLLGSTSRTAPPGSQPDPQAGARAQADVEVALATAAGVTLDTATRAAVGREMAVSGADVVDLIPGALPADRALRLLRRLRPRKAVEGWAFPRPGGHEALALRSPLAERMGLGRAQELDHKAMAHQTVKAQRYATDTTVRRLVPGLQPGTWSAKDRWDELESATAFAWPGFALAPALLSLETAHLLAMTAGALVNPAAGLAALASWSLQPSLVFGGDANAGENWPLGGSPTLRPPDLGSASLKRLPQAWADNVRTALAGWRATRAREVARVQNPPPQPPPIDERFEARRTTCPWCESEALQQRAVHNDVVQLKPGTFRLDECTDCGHIFQNPTLSIAGLNYYYDGFYDGLGEDSAEFLFGSLQAYYQARIESMARVTEPHAWLDVGTGHGHFCLAARQRWPQTRFDGLDMSESVEEAQRRGWIDTAYRGMFPDLADGLPRSYDVVSMHHYLEHCREPVRELAAAAKVLQPGGHLMIEVPDPESPWARRLGQYWVGWMQPQHLHFVSCDNLVAALPGQGFEVVSVERGAADMGVDLFTAAWLRLTELAPSPHLPWRPSPSVAPRVGRVALLAAAAPILTVVGVVDKIKDARVRPEGIGNAYRVVARRL